MHAKRLLVVLTLGMCLLFAAGCAQQTKPTSSEDNTKPGQTEQAASTKNNAREASWWARPMTRSTFPPSPGTA